MIGIFRKLCVGGRPYLGLWVVELLLVGAMFACHAACDSNHVAEVAALSTRLGRDPNDQAALERLIGLASDASGASIARANATAQLGVFVEEHSEEFASVIAPTLIRLIDDQNPYVRREAARAAGALGPRGGEAVPALAKALGQYLEWDVGVFAAMSLGKIRSRPEISVPALVDAIKRGRLIEACEAVGQFGVTATGAVATLEDAMGDQNRRFATQAAAALAKIEPTNTKLAHSLYGLFLGQQGFDRYEALVVIHDLRSSFPPDKLREIREIAGRDDLPETKNLAQTLTVD